MLDSLPSNARGPHLAGLVLLCSSLAACGTTSSLQAPAAGTTIDLTPYRRLLVVDFSDEATAKAPPEARPQLSRKLADAVIAFPDQIASVADAGGGFEAVTRSGTPDATTLVLRGAITQFDPGNAALRWMVGFTAGNVNFDARLQLLDGGTGRTLGTWTVDKNSWALGGGIAATQTPEEFMQQAAAKVGTELSEKRRQGSVSAPSGSR